MGKRSPFLTVLLAVSVVTLISVRAHAQVGADRVAVTGLVTDPTGAAVPDAAITLRTRIPA